MKIVKRYKWSSQQKMLLQDHFETVTRFPTKSQCLEIASRFGVSERRIRVWFQNHRQRLHVLKKGDPVEAPPVEQSIEAAQPVYAIPLYHIDQQTFSSSCFDILPPPEWAVFAACTMRAFPMLRLEKILEGIQSILPVKGSQEVFIAARRAVLAHAEDPIREDLILMGQARDIATYCFCHASLSSL